MIANEIKPSQLKDWHVIDQSKANKDFIKQPDIYGWYKVDGIFWPHRKPTVTEMWQDKFN